MNGQSIKDVLRFSVFILYFIFISVYVYGDKIHSITKEKVEKMLEVSLKCLVPHTLSERNSSSTFLTL